MATISEVNVGSAVSWSINKDPDPPSTIHGIVTSINSEEEILTVKVWAILEDGSHEETDRSVKIEVGKVRIIKDFRSEGKQLSARVEKVLRGYVEEHNGKNPKYRVTMRMLRAVFRRGVGAYRNNPSSVRGNVRSADQWAFARCRAFMTGLRTGKFPRSPFDTDLLPANHPNSSKGQKGLYDDLDFTIPKGVKKRAQYGLDLRKKFGRGGTSVGLGTARYLVNNTKASPEKVRKIARYFPRHAVDLETEDSRDFLAGRTDRATNGVIAWELWGGNEGRRWSNKLVSAMNKRDEKARSAVELVRRRNLLKEIEREELASRFESEETKDILYKQFNDLLKNWDYALAVEYYKLLDRQRKDILSYIKNNTVRQAGLIGVVDYLIDQNTKNWKSDIYDLYLSMMTDYYYYQFATLLPENIKSQFTEEQDQAIRRQRRRKPTREVVTEGFYPLRSARGVQIPLENLSRNSDAIGFVNDRLNTLFPEMSKTRKQIVNRSLRKSLDAGRALGLRGTDLDDYVANELSQSLTKRMLGDASKIARTEGLALSQWGQEQGAKKTGLKLEKSWLTRRDGKVRDAHRLVDNQRVAMSGQFNVLGYKMDYPADSKFGAPVELIVNCRCTTIYHNKRITRKA
jgi:hypothetical protein